MYAGAGVQKEREEIRGKERVNQQSAFEKRMKTKTSAEQE